MGPLIFWTWNYIWKIIKQQLEIIFGLRNYSHYQVCGPTLKRFTKLLYDFGRSYLELSTCMSCEDKLSVNIVRRVILP